MQEGVGRGRGEMECVEGEKGERRERGGGRDRGSGRWRGSGRRGGGRFGGGKGEGGGGERKRRRNRGIVRSWGMRRKWQGTPRYKRTQRVLAHHVYISPHSSEYSLSTVGIGAACVNSRKSKNRTDTSTYNNIKTKIHSSCEIEYFVETHFCKLCVILRSRVLRVVCPH